MKKRILALIFAATLLATAMSGCKKVDEVQQDQEKTLDERVQVIADYINTWKFDKSAYEGKNPVYDYCITDLDQNGRIELITSVEVPVTGNSGVYETVIKYYELNEEATALFPLERVSDSDSQPDVRQIIDRVNTVDANGCYRYVDKSSNRCYYIFCDKSVEYNEDGTKNNYESRVAISINKGKVYEETLATYKILRERGKDAVEVYVDASGKTITKEQFDNIAKTKFAGCEESKVMFGWQACTSENFDKELDPASDVFIKKLAASFEVFKNK